MKKLLLILVAALGLSHIGLSAKFVQSRNSPGASGTSIVLAYTSNLGGGSCSSPSPSFLIVAVMTNGNRNSTITASDTKTSTWTKDITDATNGNIHVFSAPNVASGADTITVSWTTSTTARMAIHEYCGVLTAGAFDKTQQNGSAGATNRTSNSTAATTQADELLFGVMRVSAADTSWTSTNSFTTRETVDTSGSVNLATLDRIVTATGTYAATGTGTQAGSTWFMGIATYKSSETTTASPIILGARRRR